MTPHVHRADELVELGKSIIALLNPQWSDYAMYVSTLDNFIVRAEAFSFAGTINVARPMQRHISLLAHSFTSPREIIQLQSTARGVEHALNGDAIKSSVIVSDVDPPPELLNLVCAEDYQTAMRDDVATCLRAGLNRPAIVTAWALGYDLIRCWVFGEPARLDAFNAQLKNQTVTKYEDFFDVVEHRVLKTCCDSKDASLNDFTDRTYRTLQGLLDERNNFAHANFELASPTTAKAYVEKLIRVVTGKPFA